MEKETSSDYSGQLLRIGAGLERLHRNILAKMPISFGTEQAGF